MIILILVTLWLLTSLVCSILVIGVCIHHGEFEDALGDPATFLPKGEEPKFSATPDYNKPTPDYNKHQEHPNTLPLSS